MTEENWEPSKKRKGLKMKSTEGEISKKWTHLSSNH